MNNTCKHKIRLVFDFFNEYQQLSGLAQCQDSLSIGKIKHSESSPMHLTNSVTNSVVGTDFNSLDKESILSKSYNFSHALSPLCTATVVDTLQSGWQSLLLQDIDNVIPIPDKCNISASSGHPPPYNWGLNFRVYSFIWFLSERCVRAAYRYRQRCVDALYQYKTFTDYKVCTWPVTLFYLRSVLDGRHAHNGHTALPLSIISLYYACCLVYAVCCTAGLSHACMHWRHAIPCLYDGLRKWKFTGGPL